MQEVLGHSNAWQICQDSQVTGHTKPSLMEQAIPIYKEYLKKQKRKPTQNRIPKAKADLTDVGSASPVPKEITPAASVQLQCCAVCSTSTTQADSEPTWDKGTCHT